MEIPRLGSMNASTTPRRSEVVLLRGRAGLDALTSQQSLTYTYFTTIFRTVRWLGPNFISRLRTAAVSVSFKQRE